MSHSAQPVPGVLSYSADAWRHAWIAGQSGMLWLQSRSCRVCFSWHVGPQACAFYLCGFVEQTSNTLLSSVSPWLGVGPHGT